MYVDCPRCQTKYLLDNSTEKTVGERTFKCPKCQDVFSIICDEDDMTTQFVQSSEDILQLPADKNLYLKVLEGPKVDTMYQLSQPVITIGRGSKVELYIPDASISRKHCVLEISPNKTLLRDLGSKNGIIVNGKRIDSNIIIQNRSEFILGDSRLCYIEVTKENS